MHSRPSEPRVPRLLASHRRPDLGPAARILLIALSLAAGSTPAVRASSIHYSWELPDSYSGGGSPFPAQAAPGTTTSFYASAPRFDMAWWWNPSQWTYQWYFNGVAIPGETRWSLTLSNLTASHSGNYAVRWSARGFPEHWDYFPLTVAPQPATPLVSSVTVPIVGAAGVQPVVLFPNGRLVLNQYPLEGQYSGNYFHIVSPDGRIEQTINLGTPGPSVGINFFSDGRYLRSNAAVPGLADLLGTTDFTIELVEELPGDNCIIRARQIPYTWITNPKVVTLHLTREFFIDYSFPPVFGEPPTTGGVPHAGHFLFWDGQMVVARLADGSPDPAFHPFSLTNLGADVSATGTPDYRRSLTALDDGTVLVIAVDRFIRLQSDGTPIPGTQGSATGAYLGRVSRVDGHVYFPTRRIRTSAPTGDDPTFFLGTEPSSGNAWSWVVPKADGQLLAGRSTASGYVLATLRTDVAVTPIFPVIEISSLPALTPGAALTIAPRVRGEGPFTYQWVALDGGELPTETTGPTLTFPAYSRGNVGHYQLRVTNAHGTSLSPAYSMVPPQIVRLMALSGRGVAEAGQTALVAGWSSHASSYYLVRGVGPTLANYGVNHFAADPALEVFDSTGLGVTQNDNWTADLQPRIDETGASPLIANSKDAAALNVNGGLHTLHVTNAAGRGIALAEIYEANIADTTFTHLTALSLRGFAGQGEETLVGGFVLDDRSGLERPLRVLLRVVGPALAQYGITQPLADPELRLFNARGELVASNDNWDGTTDNRTRVAVATEQVKLTPLPAAGRDAALVVELPPGAYTVHAGSRDGSTGVALIEIYRAD